MVKSIVYIIFFLIAGFTSVIMMNGCVTASMVEDKSGANLWTEKCSSCHNKPGSGDLSHENWEKISSHMIAKTDLYQTDVNQIIDYLKTASK